MKKRFINSKDEHNKVLFELGLLDDDDDYQLFLKMPDDTEGIDTETYLKYTNKKQREK